MTADINYRGPVVAIDLDDTLYPEADYVLSAFEAISHALERRDGLSPGATLKIMQRARRIGDNPFDALLDAYAKHISRREFFIPLCVEIYRYHSPTLTLPERSRTFLEELRRRGIPMALVTDGRVATQWAKVRALHLEEYFSPSMVWISQERGIGKLSDAPWTAIVRKYPEAGRFVAIGDNPAKDFLYPNLLGFDTFMIKDDGTFVHDQKKVPTPAHAASHTVKSLSDIKI